MQNNLANREGTIGLFGSNGKVLVYVSLNLDQKCTIEQNDKILVCAHVFTIVNVLSPNQQFKTRH